MKLVKIKEEKLFEIDHGEKVFIEKGTIVLLLGEIDNMKGHYAFSHKGKIFWGYHYEDNFEELSEDEI